MTSAVSGLSALRFDASDLASDLANGNDFAASLQRMSARGKDVVSAAAPARISPALENTAGLDSYPANYGPSSALGNDPKVNNANNMAEAPPYAPLDQGARMNVYNAAAGDGAGLNGRPDMTPNEYVRAQPEFQGNGFLAAVRTDFRVDSA